ncbi:hypothetical protein V6N12_002912 [Hibiscus sabdariffa]|uniref:Uncharacterized protein n=1 Tax=Hibiscus sabdariffa TaxID=183260 RepID=A0ABR2EAT6_9ROSI
MFTSAREPDFLANNVHAKEVENSGYSFPETHDYRRKERKYASLFELQDKALSEIEKKRRDRALKKCKKTGKAKVNLEIVDYSPRKQILTRAARKTLAIGKRVGFQFIGNEEDVIEDLVELELQQD